MLVNLPNLLITFQNISNHITYFIINGKQYQIRPLCTTGILEISTQEYDKYKNDLTFKITIIKEIKK
jgi:hypothetical protein